VISGLEAEVKVSALMPRFGCIIVWGGGWRIRLGRSGREIRSLQRVWRCWPLFELVNRGGF
jgi:hypothetical protein